MSSITLGLDVGSTYTKAVLANSEGDIVSRAIRATGSGLVDAAERVTDQVLEIAGIPRSEVRRVITTGSGRHLIPFRDLQVTDLTATARGALHLFPATRTVLDVGGQTMKASRLDTEGQVKTFRLNDKCAAGTGTFLEKTARYMGYDTDAIEALLATDAVPVPISGVCAVFAESEVISHLSEGVAPESIMVGAVRSLTSRSVQLMRRIGAEAEFTLVGGILRWSAFADQVTEALGARLNVPEGELPQFVAALGCAVLGQQRIEQRRLRGRAGAVG